MYMCKERGFFILCESISFCRLHWILEFLKFLNYVNKNLIMGTYYFILI